MRDLGALFETGKAPSDYYGLRGLQALLFDRAILWGSQHLPKDKRPAGVEVRG